MVLGESPTTWGIADGIKTMELALEGDTTIDFNVQEEFSKMINLKIGIFVEETSCLSWHIYSLLFQKPDQVTRGAFSPEITLCQDTL